MAKPKGVIRTRAISRSGYTWQERCFIPIDGVACSHEVSYNGLSSVIVELKNGEWYHVEDTLTEWENKWNAELV